MSSASAESSGSTLYVTLLASVAALGGLLFGYDTAVISGAIGFLRLHFDLDPQYATGWAAACALLGCAAGAGMAGALSDRLGRKKVLVLSAVAFLVSALGTAFPTSFPQFILFRMIGGLGIGAASMASPMYIAEISPARIRGRMVSVNQFAIVSGMVIVYFVNYFIAARGTALDRQAVAASPAQAAALEPGFAREIIARYAPQIESEKLHGFLAEQTEQLDAPALAAFLADNDVVVEPETIELVRRGRTPWNEGLGWRWMFGSGAFPSLLLLALLFVVPESPRWLTKQGRRDRAAEVLTRVGGPEQARRELREIEDALAHEGGSLGQLFLPGMRIVLVIGVVLAVLQQVTGINVFLYFAPEIFKKMKAGTDAALLQTVLVGAVNMLFTIIAIWTVDRLGRKPLMLIGFIGMGVCLVAMGLAAYFRQTEIWVLSFILGYIACFALSVGPVTWVILAEIFPTKIRGRAMAIATVCLWVANFIVTQTFTMMDGNAWLVQTFRRALPFWIYAALCAVSIAFVWRWVPETKGKTLEEIERGWTG
jgi:MFS family permease